MIRITEGIKNALQEKLQPIVQVLEKGDRVELIPVKDGVKAVRVRRNEIAFCRTASEGAGPPQEPRTVEPGPGARKP